MERSNFGTPRPQRGKIKPEKTDDVVARARQAQKERERSYREKSLQIHPWICARCGREYQ